MADNITGWIKDEVREVMTMFRDQHKETQSMLRETNSLLNTIREEIAIFKATYQHGAADSYVQLEKVIDGMPE